MQQGKEKQIGQNVTVRSEPGRLSVTIIQRLGLLWKTVIAVMLGLSLVTLLVLSVLPSSPDPRREAKKTNLTYVLIVIATMSTLRLLLPDNKETISVFQGTLTIRTKVTLLTFNEEFPTHAITRLGLNIPAGKNFAKRKFALTQRVEKRFSQRYQPCHGALSFFYGDDIIELAHQVDRLSATYILKELENALTK